MNPRILLLLALFGALASTSACRLSGASGSVGVECTSSHDCGDNKLGCVPIDETKPNGTRVCMPPDADWICAENFFGDGACDCGCGFLDVDCVNKLASSCAAQDGNNCPQGKNPVPDDNTKCQ
ncbi:MAG TPA: hypothetical protein VGO62_14435 [Myxococcota bacterium]